jgi:hypothetical protein
VNLLPARRNRGDIVAMAMRQLCDRPSCSDNISSEHLENSVENSSFSMWMVLGYRERGLRRGWGKKEPDFRFGKPAGNPRGLGAK